MWSTNLPKREGRADFSQRLILLPFSLYNSKSQALIDVGVIKKNMNSQVENETHWKPASHAGIETHVKNVSQRNAELPDKLASQRSAETHLVVASHTGLETQTANASQNKHETQFMIASQGTVEAQTAYAKSHGEPETHSEPAESHLESETQEACADGGGGDGKAPPTVSTPINPFFLIYIILRRLVDILYDLQEVRIRTANRERGLPKKTEPLASKILEDLEKVKDVEIKELLIDIPVYYSWLNAIKGIGPRLAGSWISRIALVWKPVEDPTELQKNFEVKTIDKQTRKAVFLYPVYRGIEAFPTISSLWKYCGQDVYEGYAPVRRHGEQLKRNPYMCTLAWKTRKQFIMLDESDSTYRKLYDEFKKDIAEAWGLTAFKEMKDGKETVHYDCVKCVGERRERCRVNLAKAAKRLAREVKHFPCRGHVEKMAARKMAKEFIKHLWIEWRRAEGLPISGTYERDILGHSDG